MDKKLIFLDIDGTILAPGEGIHLAVQDGLHRARNHGHQIFICTGRAYTSLPEELEQMELDGVIASAGSDIWIYGQNAYRKSLSLPLIEKACEFLKNIDGIYVLESFDETYISESGGQILLEQRPVPGDNPEMIRWKNFVKKRKNVKNIKDWNPNTAPVPKITFIVWNEDALNQIYKALGKDFYVAIFQRNSSIFFNGELISRIDNKGTAIQKTVEILRADIKNTVAFGDSMNDYHMIQQAAEGIAMGNADEKLKEIANRVCESVEEDGVIKELQRMRLI